jgi:hypothetical protein
LDEDENKYHSGQTLPVANRVYRIGVEGVDNLDTFIETIEQVRGQLILLEPHRNWKFVRTDRDETPQGTIVYLVFDDEH